MKHLTKKELWEIVALIMIIFLIMVSPDYTFGASGEFIVNRTKSSILPLAQGAGIIGLIIGGGLLSFGPTAELGMKIVKSAMIGTATVFAGPFLWETIRSILGS